MDLLFSTVNRSVPLATLLFDFSPFSLAVTSLPGSEVLPPSLSFQDTPLTTDDWRILSFPLSRPFPPFFTFPVLHCVFGKLFITFFFIFFPFPFDSLSPPLLCAPGTGRVEKPVPFSVLRAVGVFPY